MRVIAVAAALLLATSVLADDECDKRVATVRAEAEQRIAEIQRDADRRVAAARAGTSPDSNARLGLLARLREADTLASDGDLPGAARGYTRVAHVANAPRDILIAAAIGLYRTGAFAEALDAFRRLGAFSKGEEDLRFYKSVALYETGSYDEARTELLCALPFIEVDEDIERIRAKIVGTQR